MNRLKELQQIILRVIKSLKLVSIGNNSYRVKGLYLGRFPVSDDSEDYLNFFYHLALECKKGAFIDVGTNTGQTLYKVLSIDENREYVGFEPQIDSCFFLNEFIKENELKAHRVFPVGLSNQTEITKLYRRMGYVDTSASVVEGFRPQDFYRTEQLVYLTTGDKILNQLGLHDISAVKIDVEGGELEVVEGMKKVLSEHKPFIFFEVLNNFIKITGQSLDPKILEFRQERVRKLENLLRCLNYQVVNLSHDGNLKEMPSLEESIADKDSSENYLAIHQDYTRALFDRVGNS